MEKIHQREKKIEKKEKKNPTWLVLKIKNKKKLEKRKIQLSIHQTIPRIPDA
jgi:hypothetical protein